MKLEELLNRIDIPTDCADSEWKMVEQDQQMISLAEYYSSLGLDYQGAPLNVPQSLVNVAKKRLNSFEGSVRDSVRGESAKVPWTYYVVHGMRKFSVGLVGLFGKKRYKLKPVREAWGIEVKEKYDWMLSEGLRFIMAMGPVNVYNMWRDVNDRVEKAVDYLEKNPDDYNGLYEEYCKVA
ncbi:hypothetical protein ACFL0V_00275 [Nanoarchaeota archaeon]